MKNQIYKDKKKRILNYKLENKKFILKSILKNVSISKLISYNSNFKFTEFSNSSYLSSLVNRCVVTGRKKKIQRMFRFSRLSFLNYARNGCVNGLTKSIW